MEKTKLETPYIVAFSLLGIFPIVPFVVKPLLAIPLLATSLLHFFYIDKRSIDWKIIIISSCIYLLFAVSSLYTDDSDRAVKLLSRLIPFLVFPISFAMVPKSIYIKLTDTFINVYTVSCFLFSLVVFAYCISLNSTDIYYIFSEISNNFLGYEDHPIYISLYFGIALIFLLFRGEKSLFSVILFIVILLALLFLSRKGNILSLILILFFVAISNIKKLYKRKHIVYYVVGVLVIVGTFLEFNDFVLYRFKELLVLDQVLDNSKTSTGIRNIIWQTALNLSVESPLIGHGLGNVQDLIDASFVRNGYGELTLVLRYNAHNQYLQIVLISGYIGLLIFLSILTYIFIKIKNQKWALYIFSYILFCFMFESLLERQNGIFITALFFNLFLFLPQKEIK